MDDTNSAGAAVAASASEEARPAPATTWWYAATYEAERWHVGGATMDEAIAAGRLDCFTGGEAFCVAEAHQQSWRFDCFDSLDEEFDNTNEELGDGDGDPPSIDAGIATVHEGVIPALRRHLEAALSAWIVEHGNATAWSLGFQSYHDVPALAEPAGEA